jgi:predicted DNA-binding transcriptional regulator AlpA
MDYQPSTADRLLITDEASEMMRTPVATLAYWRHVGTGPRSAKIGRRVVYRESDVRAWLDAQFNDVPA